MTTTLAVPSPVVVGSPARRKNSFYRPELDVLRFFAFLAVFLYHFTRPVELYVEHGVPRVIASLGNGLVQGGVFGVDLFFVLSAYLITELLLRGTNVGRLTCAVFTFAASCAYGRCISSTSDWR